MNHLLLEVLTIINNEKAFLQYFTVIPKHMLQNYWKYWRNVPHVDHEQTIKYNYLSSQLPAAEGSIPISFSVLIT